MLYYIRCVVPLCFLHYTVTHNDILYTGMMYHEERKVGYWKTIYSVVKDLDVLKKVTLSL